MAVVEKSCCNNNDLTKITSHTKYSLSKRFLHTNSRYMEQTGYTIIE